MDFDRARYKIYNWKNGIILYWILNPLIAFNELILGRRVPRLALVDKTSDKPKIERICIPCPHCHTLHDGRIWSMQNNTLYKNWFGLYCPECGGIIPCVINITSAIFLTLTFPLWIWFYRNLKNEWLLKQPARYTQITLDQQGHLLSGNGWLIQGLIWGLLSFILTSGIMYLVHDKVIVFKDDIIGILIWLIGGLGWGYTMKQVYDRYPKLN